MIKNLTLITLISLSGCGSKNKSSELANEATNSKLYACHPRDAKRALVKLWEVNEFANPESVVYDRASKSYFVSNIDGGAVDKDGKAHITRLSSNGKVLKRVWASGIEAKGKDLSEHLNAPKGLRIRNGILWTADIDQVVGFDIPSGKVTARVKVPGSVFLNDLDFDPKTGNILVSDMALSKIFAVAKGGAQVFSEGEKLEYPNGVLVRGQQLVIASWGPGLKKDFSTTAPGQILTLNLDSKVLAPWGNARVGHLDGIEADGNDAFLISDWMAGRVFRVTKTGDCETLLELAPGTADISWESKTRTLVVPRTSENIVSAYRLPR